MVDKIKQWAGSHPYWVLSLVTLAALAPFLAKPFNIDDPLFIWSARHIRAHPLDPYGFYVEWGWTEFPMWKVTENPPLTCYFIALISLIFGWGEIGLHLAFLLPAVALILGTYRLATRFCNRPARAALVTIFAPVFMVSGLTIMCDVTMLAFWVWAAIFWMEGIEGKKPCKLTLAGILIALAEVTKYYGACLMPLLAVYGLATRRPLKQWVQFLLIPLAVLCAYQHETALLYGGGLFSRAMDYATFSKSLYGFSRFQNGLVALSFTGGCMASAVLFLPLLWHKREWSAPGLWLVLASVLTFLNGALWEKYSALRGAELTSAKIQLIFWATGGLCLLQLAVTDLWRCRDARSLLLFFWVAGTFVFAAGCNWTVNARSILPLCPAVAILVARRLEARSAGAGNAWPAGIIGCLIASYILAWSVTMSDYSMAGACRQSAQEVCDKFKSGPGTLWFQGHWGFQYYMNEFGASALDFKNSPVKPGDLLAVPSNNTNILPPDPHKTALLGTLTILGAQYLSTFDPETGGGFYASAIGPLPFAFGSVPPERTRIYGFKFPAK